jgi:hypothetical protein
MGIQIAQSKEEGVHCGKFVVPHNVERITHRVENQGTRKAKGIFFTIGLITKCFWWSISTAIMFWI